MTKLEDYTQKEAESLAALAAATSERDRVHHRRAASIYRKLIANIDEAATRAALKPERKLAAARAAQPFSRF